MIDSYRRRRNLFSGACVLVGFAAAVAAPSAHATFPGKNGRIVFAKDEGAHQTTLWRVSARTRRTRRLTKVPSRCGRLETWEDSEPTYSPSGRRILFVNRDTCGRGERAGIYVMRADGTQRELLVRWRMNPPNDDVSLHSPTWSPDGRRVAFVRHRNDPILDSTIALFVTSARPQASPRETKVPPGDLPYPVGKISWGPAQLIASDGFSVSGGLVLVDPETGWRRNLLRWGSSPEWDPQANRIAFNRDIGDEDTPSQASVYVIRRNGRGLRRVVGARGTRGIYDDDLKRAPVWSPDGRRLAYTWDYGEGADLYVVSARGGQKRRLVKDVNRLGAISWQPVPRSRYRRTG